MKKLFCFILILTFLALSVLQTSACTGFAVYSGSKLFGMNFDYPEREVKFVLSQYGGSKIFHMDFDMNENGNFYYSVGMNDKGLMMSIQHLSPNLSYPPSAEITSNNIDMTSLAHKALYEFSKVSEVEHYLEDKIVINQFGTYHDLFADKFNNAIVVEPDTNKNSITKIKDNFIVMTNFYNSSLEGKSYKEAFGNGSARYITAYDYISQNKNSFNFDKALQTLNMTTQNLSSPTLTSMVFSPDSNEVFIVVKRDFSRVWRLSINEGIIESYRGFNKPVKLNIGEDGILMKFLQEKAIADGSNIKTNTPMTTASSTNQTTKESVLSASSSTIISENTTENTSILTSVNEDNKKEVKGSFIKNNILLIYVLLILAVITAAAVLIIIIIRKKNKGE